MNGFIKRIEDTVEDYCAARVKSFQREAEWYRSALKHSRSLTGEYNAAAIYYAGLATSAMREGLAERLRAIVLAVEAKSYYALAEAADAKPERDRLQAALVRVQTELTAIRGERDDLLAAAERRATGDAVIAEAVKAEREACAKVADSREDLAKRIETDSAGAEDWMESLLAREAGHEAGNIAYMIRSRGQ